MLRINLWTSAALGGFHVVTEIGDRIRRRMATVLMRLEDASELAAEAQDKRLMPADRLSRVDQITTLLAQAQVDCTAAQTLLQKIIRSQSE